jgi:hypothetical protein
MVHRTDIAGRSVGQASPGHGGRRSAGMAPSSKATSHPADKKCCRLLTTAVPPLHAIHLELLTL